MANSLNSVEEGIANKYHTRGNHWRVSEDQKLSQLVQEHGTEDWNLIAEHIEGRTDKSCKTRWIKYLDPNINKTPFTKEEEGRLVMAHALYGPRWATIAKLFPGRTDKGLMNHWNALMTQQKRESKKRTWHELTAYNVNSSVESFPKNVDIMSRNYYTEQRLLATAYPSGSLNFPDALNFPVLDSSGKPGRCDDPFGLFNIRAGDGTMKMSLFDNSFVEVRDSSSSSPKDNEVRASSSNEKEQTDDDGGCNDVPFYDFLGVNVDDK